MKAENHRQLAAYLADKYISDAPRRYVRAFKLGCVEPDKNFTTYFKGSIKHQWLRGHNWENMSRYIRRTSGKLERKEYLRLLDNYKLGKLIHYVADAFTLAHNDFFEKNLKKHRSYERRLEEYFSFHLQQYRHKTDDLYDSVIDLICSYHNEYINKPRSIHTDASFCIKVCSIVLDILLKVQEEPAYALL